MSTVLRKYFWVFNLLTSALCAMFAATAVGKLVESKIPQPGPPKIPHEAVVAGPSVDTFHQPDITSILSRNIFCSTCKPVEEKPLDPGDSRDTAPSPDDEPVKTSLNLKLIATLVSEEDKAWSFAAIVDNSNSKQGLYAIGSMLPGDAEVTDILARRVLLVNGGRNEYLDLLDQSGEASAPVAAQVTPAMTPAGPSPFQPNRGLEEIASGIRKVGEGRYEIERAALNKVLGNTTLLARSARIIPSVQNGAPNGFKLYAIRPGSLYALLGMMNGDTVNAINGHAITTPDKALEAYTRLRNASHLTIDFTRRGKPVSNEYTIR